VPSVGKQAAESSVLMRMPLGIGLECHIAVNFQQGATIEKNTYPIFYFGSRHIAIKCRPVLGGNK
jgi:hypothetical protein